MQMLLDLGSLGSARIWLDEQATCEFVGHSELRDEVVSDTRGWFLLDEVSLELLLSHADGTRYGLLGCAFDRSNTGGTRLRVVEGGEEASFEESLAGPHDARVGLSTERARRVLAGAAAEIRRRGSTPAGELTFAVAAGRRDEADDAIYEALGSLCVSLLDLRIEADETTAAAFIRERLHG